MYRSIKAVIDILAALFLIILISPVMLVAGVALALSLRGNPLFFQQRPGKKNRVFTLVKFRTMTNERNENGNLLPDAERLTKVGKFVRSTSLDEIPQLINVIKGDMSLVGPRPLLVKYLDRYTPQQARRHEVKPGITGWAQVNGRNAISWNKKLALDAEYVDRMNFWLDLKILWLTLRKVVQREGISSGTAATMEEFRGSGS